GGVTVRLLVGHRQVGGWPEWDGAVPAPVPSELPSYRGYRYPIEIISHAVWLYFRFSLSLREVEELLADRGVTVTYETIRAWCAKFGPSYPLDCAGAVHARVTNGIW